MVLNKFSVAQNFLHRPEFTYYVARKLPVLYICFNFH